MTKMTTEDAVLYLKYRPKSLDEIVGHQTLIKMLKSQLSKGAAQPLSRSLLFHGPTGCGKTTLGRIVAAELGAKGSDVTEVDSADFRGIDTIREIRRNSAYKPLESPCRVWILDECHRLTNDSQAALLKALEDTPSHVYFILCTTEPQKLLPTIRGRCADYQVQPLNDKGMKILLKKIVRAEGESLDKKIYDQIIQDSLGHPRNALQILAQVLAVSEEQRLEVAKKTAELESEIIELCRALTGLADWYKVAGILKGLKGEDPEKIRRAVLGYCQTILLSKNEDHLTAAVMEEFLEPFYNTGFPGLVFACYSVMHSAD